MLLGAAVATPAMNQVVFVDPRRGHKAEISALAPALPGPGLASAAAPLFVSSADPAFPAAR